MKYILKPCCVADIKAYFVSCANFGEEMHVFHYYQIPFPSIFRLLSTSALLCGTHNKIYISFRVRTEAKALYRYSSLAFGWSSSNRQCILLRS